MRDFKRGGGGFGGNRNRGGFGGGSRDDRGGRDGGRTQMYPAVCAQCNKSCEVPFKSNGQRPVLCRDCFEISKGNAPMGGGNSSARRDFNSAPTFAPARVEDNRIDNLKKQLDIINSKLDRLVALMEPAVPATVINKEVVSETAKPASKIAPKAVKLAKAVAKKAAPKKKK